MTNLKKGGSGMRAAWDESGVECRRLRMTEEEQEVQAEQKAEGTEGHTLGEGQAL